MTLSQDASSREVRRSWQFLQLQRTAKHFRIPLVEAHLALLAAAIIKEGEARADPPPAPVILSAHELSIVECFADGLEVEEAAAKLGIPHETLKSQTRRLAQRTQVKGKTSLVDFAYRTGFFPSRISQPPTGAAMTPREKQVFHGMRRDQEVARTARELSISMDTVKTHARKIFVKLGARNRAHAVALGYKYGLLEPLGLEQDPSVR